jgi:PAS domain S-box-containing protein
VIDDKSMAMDGERNDLSGKPMIAMDLGVGAGIVAILDAIDLPIVVIGGGCKIVRFNGAAASVLRISASDLGRSPGSILSGVPGLDELCAQVIADETPFRRDFKHGDRWFLLRLAPYRGPAGMIGAVLTFTNVTGFRVSLDQAIYEREYTKAILNTVIVPLVVLDADLRVQTANQAFYTLLHCSRDEVRGVPLYNLGDAEWKRSPVWESLKATLAENMEFDSVELEREFPEVGRRTILIDARRISRAGDAALLMTLSDISDRKRAELNGNLLAAIVESSDDAIVSKDLNGIILSWNRGAERLFGYTTAEVVGKSITIIIPPDHLDEEPKILELLKRGERVEHFETTRIRKDGSRLNIS